MIKKRSSIIPTIAALAWILLLPGAVDAEDNMDNTQKKMKGSETQAAATFAGGCFWCMEPPFDKLDGVISTTSGYMGGQKEEPTYKEVSAGGTGHAEVVQILYDPSKVTYAELLEVFWRQINPTTPDRQFVDVGSQYRAAIFYHDEEQRRLAEETKVREEALQGKPVYTEIRPASEFYLAEGYHQKYYLRQESQLLHEYRVIYPDEMDFINSTAVVRVNGYVGGHGTSAALEEELDSLGLSGPAADRLRYIVAAN